VSFEEAGKQLIDSLERGLYDSAKDVMRESLIECPISDADTYVPQFFTRGAGPGRQVIFTGLDPEMVGDAGVLRRSSRVFAPVREADRSTVEMGYGFGEEVNPAGRVAAEYAVPVHERSEVRHRPPEKSHFLSDVVYAFASHFGDSMEKAAKEQAGTEELGTVTGTDLGA
jgi:hypothetical protein